MSDNSQLQGSPTHRRSAKTRYATSCTECRRRKQKCNQGHPCSNCVRRFPQPTCEYSTKVIKRPTGHGSPGNPNVKLVLEGDAYSHLDLAEVQDAILQVEGIVSNGKTEGRTLANRRASDSSDEHGSPPGSSSSDSEPFRVVVTDETGTLKPKTVLALLKVILQARLKVANRIVNDEWSIDGGQLLQAVQRAVQPPSMIGGLDDQLRNLPMKPTRMNIELVRIHLQLLSRFKASLDGNPDPESRFMKHWVPLSIKDPLLLQIVLYTATCFLNETGRVPKQLVWAYKGVVHEMLNEQLRSAKMQTSDAAIMGIAQMVIDSWYWGTTEELRAHMAGLKAMISMRGGSQKLGMQGFLAKTVLMHDLVIALAHELEPTMYGHPGFEFQDDFMVPYQVSFNSPLLSDWPPFHSPASTLRIHPLSAEILDDMRSIITAVLKLPKKPTAEQLREVKETARWYFEKLNHMPADVTVYDGRHGDDNVSMSGAHDAASSSPAAYSDRSSPRNEPPPAVETPPGQAFTDDSGSSPRSIGPPIDIMYRCVRTTAAIYYRAIIARVPTTEIVAIHEFLQLWEMVWEVTLSTWKTAVGIFVWVMLAAVPSCHHTPAARFIKTLMVAGFMTMGLENWHVAIAAAEAALKFQQWLREGDQEGTPMAEKGVVGGERMIQEHGFALREALPEVAELRVDDEEPDSME